MTLGMDSKIESLSAQEERKKKEYRYIVRTW
jgi:hypothetical protein